MTSISSFQTNVWAQLVDLICIFVYTHSPYFMCHCTEYKLSALQVRTSEENKLNATTQQFITAKIAGCALKQGSETHLSPVFPLRTLYTAQIFVLLRTKRMQLRNHANTNSQASPALKGPWDMYISH